MNALKTKKLCIMAGSAALTLALALGGCGKAEQAADTGEATEEQAAADVEANDEIEIPELVSASVDAHKDIAATGDATGAESFDELPTRNADEIELDNADIPEADEDAESKVPADQMLLSEGGIQMAIPSNWLLSRDADGFVFTNQDSTLLGYLFSVDRRQGQTYDYEAMVRAIPQHELDLGYTAVEVIDASPLYTTNGDTCGYNVMFWESFDGGEYYHFVAYIESKKHLNVVEFMGSPSAWETNGDAINACLNSINFLPEQMVA